MSVVGDKADITALGEMSANDPWRHFGIGQIVHCEKLFSRNASYERCGALLRLDVRGLNDRPPLFDLRLLNCGESRGRSLVARWNLLAKLDQTLADR